MNDAIIIDDTDIFPVEDKREPEVTQPEVSQPEPIRKQQCNANWPMIIVLCAIAFMVGSRFQGCDFIPIPDDDSIVIDEMGKFALVIEDKTEEGQSKLSDGQKTTLNSKFTEEAITEAGFTFKKIDARDDISEIEPVWQTLKGKADQAPSLTVTNKGRLNTRPLPDSVEEVKAAMELVK